jgi:serine beta-lactamase-like protein LACTB, mitochondrial
MSSGGRVAKSWNRIETWLAVIVLGVGGIILAVGGLWVYMSATARPLHPDPTRVPSATRADPSPQFTEAVERGRQIAREFMAEQNLPGLSVAVGINGDLVWAEGFGWANLEKHVPVAPDTRFRIGNASVALTSAAAGLLIEQGRLKLDDEIQVYVPEYSKKQWPVTVRQVMGHLAGMRTDGGDEGPLFSQRCERPIDGVQRIAEYSLLFEPGTQYRFSSFGWIVMSAAIEAAAKEPFLTFMQKQVFEPLHMDDTMPDASIQPIENQATSYFPKFAGDPRYGNDLMRDVDYTCYAGASAFLSTPPDLVRFAMAMNTGKLLQLATLELLQTSQRMASGQETGYGLGWDLETVTLAGQQTRSIGHDGEVLGGTAGSLVTFRDRGIAVAVLSNTSYADTPAAALKIAEVFVKH